MSLDECEGQSNLGEGSQDASHDSKNPVERLPNLVIIEIGVSHFLFDFGVYETGSARFTGEITILLYLPLSLDPVEGQL